MKENIIRNLLNSLNAIREQSAYWFPLTKINNDIPVAAYNIDKIYADEQIDLLEKVLKICNINKVISVQLNDGLVSEDEDIFKLLYEKDDIGYNFPWAVEAYYFDNTKQWLIYVSHEGTITFTGTLICSQAQAIIPDKYLY